MTSLLPARRAFTTRTRRPGLDLLGGAGSAPALVVGDSVVTAGELRGLIATRAEWLGTTRRLVLVEGAHRLDTIVTHLAALGGGHVVLLVPPGSVEVEATYRPDVLHRVDDRPREQHPGSAHDLHPDLALLLTTSGSTGNPKLVRLSREGVRANAAAIVESLGLTADDRALTTLPMHYCYGLSVLHSHLLAGASVVLEDRSVTTCGVWDRARSLGVTTLAGVPHTFDLLDAAGQDPLAVPSLRLLTQAGGRMDPGTVRRWAGRAATRGAELVVMYGQTEATARMAFLPPHFAATRPACVGVPIPGGEIRLDPVPREVCPVNPACRADATIGEIVYSGPNVMLGYATAPADLARGRDVTELRTGDLAVQHPDGLLEIVGRAARFAKVFGLRVDLDDLEQGLARDGIDAQVVEHDGGLVVAATAGPAAARAAASITERATLPGHAVRSLVLERLPRTAAGKPDRALLQRHLATLDRHPSEAPQAPEGLSPAGGPGAGGVPLEEAVRDVLATALGRPDAGPDDSFVDLGGDSLSFVEVSLRLSAVLDQHLPAGWPRLSPRALAAGATAEPERGQRRRGRRSWVELPTLLRALAILAVVGSHTELYDVMGGSHLLLALVGWNLARFTLGAPSASETARRLVRTVRRIAAPTAVVAGTVALATGHYSWPVVVQLNWLLGEATWTDDWQLWFVEAVTWPLLALAAVAAWPAAHRWERAHPFGVALGALAAASAVRVVAVGLEAGNPERYAPHAVLWCLALGWAAARADTVRRRVLVGGIAVVSCVGFFGDLSRELTVAAGVLALLAVGGVRLPTRVAAAVARLADASLWIYLTHWQVYPHLESHTSLGATVASVVVGLAAARAWARLIGRISVTR